MSFISFTMFILLELQQLQQAIFQRSASPSSNLASKIGFVMIQNKSSLYDTNVLVSPSMLPLSPRSAKMIKNQNSQAVFPPTFWLIDQCPNFLETIVHKVDKIHLCALNLAPIRY